MEKCINEIHHINPQKDTIEKFENHSMENLKFHSITWYNSVVCGPRKKRSLYSETSSEICHIHEREREVSIKSIETKEWYSVDKWFYG